jgi:hypothetical protein
LFSPLVQLVAWHLLLHRGPAAKRAGDRTDKQQDKEHKKQNLCDSYGGSGDVREAEYTGDQRQDEERD